MIMKQYLKGQPVTRVTVSPLAILLSTELHHAYSDVVCPFFL